MTQVRGSAGNNAPVGIFEKTIVDNKRYTTELTFINQPLALAGGTNSHGSLEILDFPAVITKISDVVIDLTIAAATAADTTALTSTFVAQLGIGTTAQTDVATTHTVTTGDNIVANAAKTASASVAADKTILETVTSFDGTGAAIAAFLNMAVTSNTSAANVLVNGKITFTWEDLGTDA